MRRIISRYKFAGRFFTFGRDSRYNVPEKDMTTIIRKTRTQQAQQSQQQSVRAG
jgi:hypothetical protein